MMAIHITYGEGGFCKECIPSHPHPLNNIVEQYEIDYEMFLPVNPEKQSAMDKLLKLGLTEEEIMGLLS